MNKKVLWIIIGSVVVVGGGIAVALMVSSYKKTTEHLRLLPKESFMVMDINLDRMKDKIQLADFRDAKIVKKAADKDNSDVIKDILENPVTSGVDWLSNVYAFAATEDKDLEKTVGGAVFALRSSSSFTKFMKDHAHSDVKTVKGFNYVELDDNVGACWDKKVGVICAGAADDIQDYAVDLMNQKPDAGLEKNKDFQKFLTAPYDLAMFVNMEEVPEADDNSSSTYSSYRYNPWYAFQNSSLPMLQKLYEGATIIGGISFEKDHIDWSFDVNHKDKDAADKYNFYTKNGVGKDFLKNLPAKAYGVGAGSIDVKKYIEFVDDEMKGSSDAISSTLSRSFGIELDKVPDMFTGEVAASVSDFRQMTYVHQTYDYDYTTYSYQYKDEVDSSFQAIYTVAIGVKDKAAAAKIFEPEEVSDDYSYDRYDYYSYRRKSFDKISDGLYFIKSYYGPPTYYALNSSVLVMTNDSVAAAKIASGGTLSSGSIAAPAGDIVTKNSVGYYVSLNDKDYPKQAIEYAKKEMGSSDWRKMQSALNGFKYVSSTYSSTHFSFDIYVDPKDAPSSLTFFFKKLDELSKIR